MSNRHNAGIIILVARTKILKKLLIFFIKIGIRGMIIQYIFTHLEK